MDKLLAFGVGLFFIVFISFIVALPVMLLWNWIMPMVFGLMKLTLVQSWGLFMLVEIITMNIKLGDKSK